MLVARKTRARVREGVKYAELATALAQRNTKPAAIRSGCHLLRARGLRLLDRHEEADAAAREAVDQARWYWPARLELARQSAGKDPSQVPAAMLDELREAFWLQPQILVRIRRDDILRHAVGMLEDRLRIELNDKRAEFQHLDHALRQLSKSRGHSHQPADGDRGPAPAASVEELLWSTRRLVLTLHAKLRRNARVLLRHSLYPDPAWWNRPDADDDLSYYAGRSAWLEFCRAALMFERICLKPKALAPHTPAERAKRGDLVVLDREMDRDRAHVPEGARAHVLPDGVYAALGVQDETLSTPSARALYRETDAGLSRSAAYFS
jgi:hypothetical protein